MHYDFLIEDKSGKIMLNHLLPKIIETSKHTFSIKAYNGIGRLPKRLPTAEAIQHQALLNDLPRVLKAYGKTHAGFGKAYPACVVVVCDLDNRCQKEFRNELLNILSQCNPAPITQFCIAVEEGEAWLLGDIEAIKKAYPKVKTSVLNSYTNDSICGTWEKLKEALGSEKKSEWAERITPNINITCNESPSFQYFVSKVLSMTEQQ
ncbi:MAG: hypothetical protein COV35_01605 [Alphaproteobacteria bacterium CG11_big_fil_rev_8_21_14_0_20_39_49]|nr:MAG: hypothetical protein COV35_01605 [Alphaproteobacteria bacterium CG11_big_fil_rev_8_21_14_0_20_39_49]